MKNVDIQKIESFKRYLGLLDLQEGKSPSIKIEVENHYESICMVSGLLDAICMVSGSDYTNKDHSLSTISFLADMAKKMLPLGEMEFIDKITELT